jgi:D-sedoheptulose 7-phosphate isomerase
METPALADRARTVQHWLRRTADLLLASRPEPLLAAADLLSATLRRGGKVLVVGNGGSAAEAQHLAGELVGRFQKDRSALPAVALTADGAVLTALANDLAFSEVFARQVEALGRPGDLLVALSTSGRSANVQAAVARARQRGLTVLVLTGQEGTALAHQADVALVVPSPVPAAVQEVHLVYLHLLCALVEESLFGGTP